MSSRKHAVTMISKVYMLHELLQNFIAQITHDIQNIEIVKAALYASTIGSLLFFVRALPMRFIAWLRRATLCSVTVSNNDPAYAWLQLFFAKERLGQRARRLVVSTREHVENDHDDYDDEVKAKASSSIAYKPDVGAYLIRYKGYPLLLETTRQRVEQRNMYAETLTITSVFRRKLLLDLLSEAATFAKSVKRKQSPFTRQVITTGRIVASVLLECCRRWFTPKTLVKPCSGMPKNSWQKKTGMGAWVFLGGVAIYSTGHLATARLHLLSRLLQNSSLTCTVSIWVMD
jgi:hypothetical protein